jgi:hypothetical protein
MKIIDALRHNLAFEISPGAVSDAVTSIDGPRIACTGRALATRPQLLSLAK